MKIFKAEGCFEGTESQWKRSWQWAILLMLLGLFIILCVSEFLGSIVMMMGVLRFIESYFSGAGVMGMETYTRPAQFYNVK